MRLIEDHRTSLGQNTRVGRIGSLLLDAEIGKEEVVIDDDDVRLKRLAPHIRHEAALPVGAGLPKTGLGTSVELAPQRRGLGQRIDLGAVTGLASLLPLGQNVKLAYLFKSVQQRAIAQRVELMAAEVVAAAFHVADLQRPQQRFKKGNIFEK